MNSIRNAWPGCNDGIVDPKLPPWNGVDYEFVQLLSRILTIRPDNPEHQSSTNNPTNILRGNIKRGGREIDTSDYEETERYCGVYMASCIPNSLLRVCRWGIVGDGT